MQKEQPTSSEISDTLGLAAEKECGSKIEQHIGAIPQLMSCPFEVVGKGDADGSSGSGDKNSAAENESRIGLVTSDRRELWGDQPTPQYVNQKEQLQHRVVAFMKAEGKSNKTIADTLGKSQAHVNYLLKQPWMQKQVLELIHKTGDATMEVLHKASIEAAEYLVDVVGNEKVNAETRRKAANDILDRKYGKPNQPYSQSTIPVEQMSDEELAKHLHQPN